MPTYDYDEDSMDEFQSHLETKGFYRIGAGSFRRVYRRKNVVVKVPKSHDGMCDNLIEAQAWKTLRNRPSSSGVICAPCRILPNGCLMMVVVDHAEVCAEDGTYKVEKPEWVETLDQEQAGLYKGQWVAYDYAINLVERHAWERALNIESEFFKTDYSRRSGLGLRDPEGYDDEGDEDEEETNDDGECMCACCIQDRANAEQEVFQEEPIVAAAAVAAIDEHLDNNHV